jgi:hypothetical protein
VDRPEERGDARLAAALALELQDRRRHRVEMLGRLRAEVREHVVVGGEERGQLGAQRIGRRGRSRGRRRRGGWLGGGRQPGWRGRRRGAELEGLQRRLQRGHEAARARRLLGAGVGRAAAQRAQCALQRVGEDAHVGEALQRGGAAQPVGDEEDLVPVGLATAGQTADSILEGGEGVPRLHQEDGAEELAVAGRLGHADLRPWPA